MRPEPMRPEPMGPEPMGPEPTGPEPLGEPPTWEEVRAGRMARSWLAERAPAERLVDVARDVCGIHAQVMGSAELQLAARVHGITQGDVRAALWERRELVKTWTLRGTLHIHPADELGLWTAARRAVEREEDAAVTAAIGDALRGRRLTREELADAVVERVGPEPRERLASGWGWFLGDAAAAGLLCFGPPEGARVTFVHVDDWLGSQQAWEPAAALREVARRYATTYAPATLRSLREWLAAKVDVDVPEAHHVRVVLRQEPDGAARRRRERNLRDVDVHLRREPLTQAAERRRRAAPSGSCRSTTRT